MTIGVYADVTPYGGGIYQYTLSILDSLSLLDYDVVIFSSSKAKFDPENYCLRSNFSYFNLQQIKLYEKKIGFLSRISRLRLLPKRLIGKINPLNRIMKSYKIDLMIYPFPIPLAYELPFPAISAVHDLAHKTLPEFPEFANFRERFHREFLLKNVTQNALYVLADSEIGKTQINRYYGVKPDSIKVLPFIPDSNLLKFDHIEINQKYNLPEKYIYYPAQFWHHKNHVNLAKALFHLKSAYNIKISLVLSGAIKNGYSPFLTIVKELDIAEQIYYLGYVTENEKVALYKNAVALVMPSFLGPTNIPQLEALLLDCPVVLSNTQEGTAEQIGDAAIYVNPYSPESIASGIKKVWEDPCFRQTLIYKGKEVIKDLSIKKQAFRVDSIIRDANDKLREIK